ncbi:MAG: hypothetical protein CMH57_03690 [Myxococcales bacterium]|nr:hypothetical protein [Myxococcales bacterium]
MALTCAPAFADEPDRALPPEPSQDAAANPAQPARPHPALQAVTPPYTPDAATSSCREHELVFEPIPDQFTEADGTLFLYIPVGYNLPPECRQFLKVEFRRVPKGAITRVDRVSGEITMEWSPLSQRVERGSFNALIVATYMGREIERPFTIEVEETWESFLLPGLRYNVLLPVDEKRFGIIHGAGFEYVFVTWSHQNENRGPSHGRFRLNVDLLNSTKEDFDQALFYALGLDLSFERNPKRSFLIPFFGLEVGGIYQSELGNMAQFNPEGGLYLWSGPNISAQIKGGYLLPTTALEEFQGWRFTAGFDFTLW